MRLNSIWGNCRATGAGSLFVLILIFSMNVIGQTSKTFHERLGDPAEVTKLDGLVTRERFEIDGQLTVIIDYQKSGSPHNLRILPRWSKLSDVESDRTVPQDTYRAVLHFLVPKGERGKYTMGTFLNVICLPKNDCAGVREDYENLAIYFNSGKGGMRFVDVTWNNK